MRLEDSNVEGLARQVQYQLDYWPKVILAFGIVVVIMTVLAVVFGYAFMDSRLAAILAIGLVAWIIVGLVRLSARRGGPPL